MRKVYKNGVQELMIDESERDGEQSSDEEMKQELIDLNPMMKITHDDVGKRIQDYESDEDIGAESTFDIEGKDDKLPDISKVDLRKFQYGVI